MSEDEALEVTRIYSAGGRLRGAGLVSTRPFCAPHHTVSAAALVGGGSVPHPGDISYAHRGVLFLDELPEFSRAAIEALRQPLEDRSVCIVRVGGTAHLPAAFLLVASANPCPCGWYGSDGKECICSLGALQRYRSRLSGPILDRIDLQVRVGLLPLEQLRDPSPIESSAAIRERVVAARARQAARLAPFGDRLNAEMSPAAQRETCRLPAQAELVLERLYTCRAGLTARGVERILRTARTIADLDGDDAISVESLLEAASYRALDLDPIVDRRMAAFGPLPSISRSQDTPSPAS
jgi:magnesium chelatase family protein